MMPFDLYTCRNGSSEKISDFFSSNTIWCWTSASVVAHQPILNVMYSLTFEKMSFVTSYSIQGKGQNLHIQGCFFVCLRLVLTPLSLLICSPTTFSRKLLYSSLVVSLSQYLPGYSINVDFIVCLPNNANKMLSPRQGFIRYIYQNSQINELGKAQI